MNSTLMNTTNKRYSVLKLQQTGFKEEFEKFKVEKEKASPDSQYKKSPEPDLSAGEIRWLNELRGSNLSAAEKVSLMENEIINILDVNNELRSELTQMKSKYSAISANVKKVSCLCGYSLCCTRIKNGIKNYKKSK